MKFETNIKCSGCVATATPHLNEAAGEGTWNFDMQSKVLTVQTGKASAQDVVKAMEKAGYKATPL